MSAYCHQCVSFTSLFLKLSVPLPKTNDVDCFFNQCLVGDACAKEIKWECEYQGAVPLRHR